MSLLRRTGFVAAALAIGCGSILSGQHGSSARGGSGGEHLAGYPVGNGYIASHPGAVAPRGPAPIGLQAQGAGYTGINPGALRSGSSYYAGGRGGGVTSGRGNKNRRETRNYPAGYFFTPYYYPSFDYGSSPYDDSAYQGDPAGQTAAVTANLLGAQVQRLSGEVEDLRNSQAAGNVPFAAENDPSPAAAPVTLILRNGQTVQMQSYALMNGNFWDFSKQPAKRIAVASIDLAASQKATEAAGGEFPELGAAK